MNYTTRSTITGKMILANDHYAAVPYDCTGLDSLATEDVIPAGTVIPSNDASAKGVILSHVHPQEIRADKLPAAPAETAKTALKLVQFV